MNIATNRFLVTGASGFVGEALCNKLLHQGCALRITNRFANNYASKKLVQDEVLIDSIDDKTSWAAALQKIDVVLHLAARVHVMHDHSGDPLTEFLAVNLHGTTNLARQAAQAGVKRFVYVSSIKVNGEYTESSQPFRETDDPNPDDPYAISKWEAEQALHSIAHQTGMELVIIRPPLVYGPGVKANFAKLIKLVDQGVPLPLGSIRNSRSLIYVGNLVDALITSATHPAAAGQVYLVSDGEDVSTPQLIDGLATALHRPNRVFPMPISLMHGAAKLVGKSAALDRLTQSLVIDSSKIRRELDWRPPYSMAQGLQATANWYRQTSRSTRA